MVQFGADTLVFYNSKMCVVKISIMENIQMRTMYQEYLLE